MLGRIVKFRREDNYEDLEGSDGFKEPSSDQVVRKRNETPDKQPSDVIAIDPMEETFTIDRAVDMLGFGWFQVKLSLFTGIVWMADAMEMMILSILGPALHCDWKLKPWQQALLTSIVFGGMMLSSGLWGKIADKYGRKVQLILCSMFTFFYGLLSAFSPNYLWLLILRGLVGIGIGGVPQSITLYAELLPSVARGKCIAMIELFWAVGTCFIVFVSIFVMPALGWRYLFSIAAIPLFVFFLCCFWLPESPRFDLARGQPELALQTLKRIAETNGKPMPLGKLVEIPCEDEKSRKRGQVLDLCTPDMRLTTGLLWFMWLANAFSYYGVVLMTTELFEVGDTCHGGTLEPGSEVKEPECSLLCKQLDVSDYTNLLFTTAAEFPGLFITFIIIERLGRKKTIALEFFMCSCFVYLVNFCITRTILTVFLFASRAFISGGFQATYVYTPEVYPTTIRALGLGMCSGVARIGAIITPFFAQVMIRQSVYVAINTYATVCLLGCVAALLLPVETRGREMKDSTSSKLEHSK